MCFAFERDENLCSLYDQAIKFFYEGRAYQSSENNIKALQKYEEAFFIFQKVAQEDSEWSMRAKRKMKQMDRDVRRIGSDINEKQLGSSKSLSKDAKSALERFEEWRRQERNLRGTS